MNQQLALFPLHTVLFPGSTLSLQIHEERYKEMIGICLEQQQPFGIVLIQHGEEVGEPAEPHDVGTVAYITAGLRLEDGNMLITAEGRTRFRIQHLLQTRPYLLANIEIMEEQVTAEEHAAAEQLSKLYERYRLAMASATGVTQPLADLSDDPQEISFHISAQMQISHLSKQQLLEADLDTRLDALTEALKDELRYLPDPSSTPLPEGNRWPLN